MVSRLTPLILGATLLLTAASSAQGVSVASGATRGAQTLVPWCPDMGPCTFQVDSPNSPFTFGGNIQIFPLSSVPFVGQPNTFDLGGAHEVELATSAGSPNYGALVKGSTLTAPTLNAVTSPPGATIEVRDLEFSLVSIDPQSGAPTCFQVGPSGKFSTTVVGEIIAGEVEVGIIGSVTLSLVGSKTQPTTITGTINPTMGGFELDAPLSLDFPIDGGVFGSGNLEINGQAQASCQPLAASSGRVSVNSGGVQSLLLSAGKDHAGRAYAVLGSMSGTTPGTPFQGGLLPLNVDVFTARMLRSANLPPFSNTSGLLDAAGQARASIAFPPTYLDPALVGTTLHFAYVVFDERGNVVYASNAEPLLLTF